MLRRGPLDRMRPLEAPGCAVCALPPAQKFILRGAADALAPLQSVVPLPTKPLTSANQGARSALWLGPDEWLLIDEDQAGGLEAAVGAACGGVFHSLVDVSHRLVGIEIAGERAEAALNFGVALDLHPSAFPIGAVTRTLFVKSEIVLWRRGETLWRIEVARSFAAYTAEMFAVALAGMP